MNKILIAVIVVLSMILIGVIATVINMQSKAAEVASWTATPTRTPNLAETRQNQTRVALYTPPPTWTPTPTLTSEPSATRRASSTPLKSPTIDALLKTSIANSAQVALQQTGDPVDGMAFLTIGCQRIDTQGVVKISGSIKNDSTVSSGPVSIRGIIYDKTSRQVNVEVGKTSGDRVDPGATVAYQVLVSDPRNQFSMCRVEFEKVPLQQTFTPTATAKPSLTPTPGASATITATK
jgi:hypothetical protein